MIYIIGNHFRTKITREKKKPETAPVGSASSTRRHVSINQCLSLLFYFLAPKFFPPQKKNGTSRDIGSVSSFVCCSMENCGWFIVDGATKMATQRTIEGRFSFVFFVSIRVSPDRIVLQRNEFGRRLDAAPWLRDSRDDFNADTINGDRKRKKYVPIWIYWKPRGGGRNAPLLGTFSINTSFRCRCLGCPCSDIAANSLTFWLIIALVRQTTASLIFFLRLLVSCCVCVCVCVCGNESVSFCGCCCLLRFAACRSPLCTATRCAALVYCNRCLPVGHCSL